MVHTIVAGKQVEAVLKDLRTSQQVQVGLLIGQSTKLKDYGLLVVRTPSLKELENNEDGTSLAGQTSGPFQDWWVLEHARQVVSLLPGGLNVIGLFCVCPKDTLTSLQPRLGKLLSDLSSQSEVGCAERPHSKYILLHCCTTSSRNKGHVIDVSQLQGGFWPAEVKFQSSPVQLIEVGSTLRLSFDWYKTLQGNNKPDILKSVQDSLRDSVVDVLSQALFKVNGRLVQDEGDPLVAKTKKAEQQAVEKGIRLDILTRQTVQSPSEVQRLFHPRRLRLSGSMSLMAYLHPKATCREAFEAVKEDAVRSLTSRLVALTEADCVQEAVDGLSSPLPCRMSVTVPSVSWALSEYSLPGEDIKESEGRVCDLLGVSSAQAVYLEHQGPPTLATDTADTIEAIDEHVSNTGKWEVSTQLLTGIAALIVLVVAIATWAVLYL